MGRVSTILTANNPRGKMVKKKKLIAILTNTVTRAAMVRDRGSNTLQYPLRILCNCKTTSDLGYDLLQEHLQYQLFGVAGGGIHGLICFSFKKTME